MNIIIDFDFASRHTAPSQLGVIFRAELSGPHQYLREYLKGSTFPDQISGRRKSVFRGGTCRYRDDPFEILVFCHDMTWPAPLFCTARYLCIAPWQQCRKRQDVPWSHTTPQIQERESTERKEFSMRLT